jgi:hypothetical protein
MATTYKFHPDGKIWALGSEHIQEAHLTGTGPDNVALWRLSLNLETNVVEVAYPELDDDAAAIAKFDAETAAARAKDRERLGVKVPTFEFKLRFTSAERSSIYGSTDPIVKDFTSLLDDPRLTEIDLTSKLTTDGIGYLVSQSLLTQARADELLA